METKRGKLIVIEGLNGSGKTSIFRLAKGQYADRDDIIWSREPGGVPIAEDIRGLLLNAYHRELEPQTELFLFYASRAQHVSQKVLPALLLGKNVVLDRADPSTFSFQIEAGGLGDYFNAALECSACAWHTSAETIFGGKLFDAVIYLDVPVSVGLQRIKLIREDGTLDRIERKDIEYRERVRKGYLKQAERSFFGPWYVIDATKPIELVTAEVMGILKRVIGS